MTAYFNSAVNWLLGPDIEGEHSNDPADRGGDTWYGLARRWNRDMPWPPTREQAIERYRERYWDACRCDEMAPTLAVLTFDAAVQHDPTDAARFLQQAIGATVDGKIGPRTLGKAQYVDTDRVADFLSYRAKYYTELCMNDPSQAWWARGWHRRLFLLQRFVLSL